MKGHPVAALGCPHPCCRVTSDVDLFAGKARLIADHGSGAALALQAVTHRDARWFAFNCQLKLPTASGSLHAVKRTSRFCVPSGPRVTCSWRPQGDSENPNGPPGDFHAEARSGGGLGAIARNRIDASLVVLSDGDTHSAPQPLVVAVQSPCVRNAGAFSMRRKGSSMARTSRGRAQDRRRVAGGQDYEVQYESKKTGKSKKRVKQAVKRAGNSRRKVGVNYASSPPRIARSPLLAALVYRKNWTPALSNRQAAAKPPHMSSYKTHLEILWGAGT